MDDLPNEVLIEIMEYLPKKEQLRLERVSHRFQDLSQEFDLNYLKNIIQKLPDELVNEIFSYLPIDDVAN